MPVTILPSPHLAARAYTRKDAATSRTELFANACKSDHARSKTIIQSSFQDFNTSPIHPSNNGFVRAAIAAYCQHHHLTIRPEDIWFAILSQLSSYVNAHAEELRSHFVEHEGQEELWIEEVGTIQTVDMGLLAKRMSGLLAEKVKDKELHPWIMPGFSTTTENDRCVAAVIMMGTLQKYFTFGFCLTCGLPSVTLLGEKEDWVEILRRLKKLPEFGDEPAQFAQLLTPVVNSFVKSFDEPDAESVRDFWSKIAHESSGSGPYYLSGWITAFCFWGADGKSMYHVRGEAPSGSVDQEGFDPRRPGCQLGDTLFHKVNLDKIPSGFVSVPVKVDDNGTLYDTRMVAGSLGIRASTRGGALDESRHHYHPSFVSYNRKTGEMKPSGYSPSEPTGKPGLDSVQAESGWFMYELKDEGDKKAANGANGDAEYER